MPRQSGEFKYDVFLSHNSADKPRVRDIAEKLRVFASIQNLTNNAYIVARRPAGARPGLPRTLMAGIKLRLGR